MTIQLTFEKFAPGHLHHLLLLSPRTAIAEKFSKVCALLDGEVGGWGRVPFSRI